MTDQPIHFGRDMEAVDYLMFRSENEPRSRSSMLSVSFLDRVPDFDLVRQTFDRASRVVLRLRQRVVVPVVPITSAKWIIDPDFDLDYHVRRVRAVPATPRAVLDMAQTMLAAPLDTARPLWEAVVVEGIDDPDTPAALIMKLNHAVTDGIGGVELFRQVYDFERDPPPRPMPPLPVPEDVTPTELVQSALRRGPIPLIGAIGGRVTGAVRTGLRVTRDPLAAVSDVRAMAGSVQRIVGPPPTAPSPLLRRRGLGRRVEVLDMPLAVLRGAAKSAGCSVNDAYIAGICAVLRRYHEELGAPVESVPLAMPVNLRTDDDPAGGNRFAGARLAVPVGEPDPAARMRRIRELVLGAVAEPAINALGAAAPVLSRLPAPMLGALSAIAAATDVQASNVPGYPEAPYVAGCQVVKSYPIGPVPGVAMMFVLLSQAGTCHVGVHYDSASVTDPEIFRRCLHEGFEEVLALGRPATPAKRSAKATGQPTAKAGGSTATAAAGADTARAEPDDTTVQEVGS